MTDKTDNRFYREADDPKPDAWIRMDHLRKAQQAPFFCRVEPAHRPGLDLAPIFLARPASKPKALTDEQRKAINGSALILENLGYLTSAEGLRSILFLTETTK